MSETRLLAKLRWDLKWNTTLRFMGEARREVKLLAEGPGAGLGKEPALDPLHLLISPSSFSLQPI